MSVGIMTLCPPIAWQTGSALAGRELAIPSLPILTALNMAIKIWLFSTGLFLRLPILSELAL